MKHSGNAGLCGKITVPLEIRRIVPLPSEKIAMKRIETFQLFLTWKLKPLSPKDEILLVQFLSRRTEEPIMNEIESWSKKTMKDFNSALKFLKFSIICSGLNVRCRGKLHGGLVSLAQLGALLREGLENKRGQKLWRAEVNMHQVAIKKTELFIRKSLK